jgi:hypothetical protein
MYLHVVAERTCTLAGWPPSTWKKCLLLLYGVLLVSPTISSLAS